jgi:hypothetical protein
MIEFIEDQFSLSTAEEENSIFFDDDYRYAPLPFGPSLPEGTYRIIDGEVIMIVPGSPFNKIKDSSK